MAREDEDYLLDSVEQIRKEVHQNNLMLRDIISVINTYLARHHQENEGDFGRNVLANLISNLIDLKKIRK